ncbi:ABC transporter A family member 7-like [Punica granatum]|uniref:ABC transporter A family member 7-like n=1 Tax=Punica granatum TaxID=22663 RepID=A0A218WKT3_PUNGR|nr:ABC transporter A family member 7-like [Punica granatum]OWM72642.1 hypothetical protein CDL15_Pgr013110 [Punica granatum]
MIGLTKPTLGAAYIEGMDIRTDMDRIYTCMGVCPQHDLHWDSLTGREHLLFYGRLKNLKGDALTQAVEESLKEVNLFNGGVPDKQAGRYSGSMKQRLSVAISLIGDPKVVYMDEPSTGLDPASRHSLWNAVKRTKKDHHTFYGRGEGTVRLLKARYGGTNIFTMTTSSALDEKVENLVMGLSPNAKMIYSMSGTQKFNIPKNEVEISDAFQAVEDAKRRYQVTAWGLTDTTMEDVFINSHARGSSLQLLDNAIVGRTVCRDLS